jgi:hypothetical protein
MTDGIESKTCRRCGEVKALTQYNRRASAKDGRESACRSCRAAYYAANADKCKERNKRWVAANREAVAAYLKRWRQANADAHKTKQKIYREAHADEKNAKQKIRLDANPDAKNARAAKQAIYRDTNRRDLAAKAKRHNKIAVNTLAPGYVAKCLGLPLSRTPAELLQLKREQLTLCRLARQLKRASDESSEDIDRIPGEHGRSDDAGRPAADCCEQLVGLGPEGDQRDGRRGNGQGVGLDQQQPQR